MQSTRYDGRAHDQIRPVAIKFDVYGYADASVLFELGNTIVLASITLQQGVPHFLKGQRVGWLSAEYAMLPSATHQRTVRESNQGQKNARSVEISRLIGRCLRPTVNLDLLGERTIIIDCDVLQADGGTRVAAISAASLALKIAASRWVASKTLAQNIFKDQIAAISTGIVNGVPCLDLSYKEDSSADADFNFVMTHSGLLIEVQGTSEKNPVAWDTFEHLKNLAVTGINDIFKQAETFQVPTQAGNNSPDSKPSKQVFFSLGNRINKS